jgi:hypothetical protein
MPQFSMFPNNPDIGNNIANAAWQLILLRRLQDTAGRAGVGGSGGLESGHADPHLPTDKINDSGRN